MSDASTWLAIIVLIVVPFVAGFLVGGLVGGDHIPEVRVEEYSGIVSDFNIGELEVQIIFKSGEIASFRPDKNPSLGFSVGDNVWLRVITINRRFGLDVRILENYKILEEAA